MESTTNYSLLYHQGFRLIDIEDYKGSINSFKSYMKNIIDDDDLAFLNLMCGFLNIKIHDYYAAINDFSMAISIEEKIRLIPGRSRDISYNGRSNARYQNGDFQGSIEDKRKAKEIRFSEEDNSLITEDILDYRKMLINSFEKSNLDFKHMSLIKVSKSRKSKYDLIYDFKKVINTKKRNEVIHKLELISESKFKSGDFKGAIKALRRAEKYY